MSRRLGYQILNVERKKKLKTEKLKKKLKTQEKNLKTQAKNSRIRHLFAPYVHAEKMAKYKPGLTICANCIALECATPPDPNSTVFNDSENQSSHFAMITNILKVKIVFRCMKCSIAKTFFSLMR